MIHGSIFRFEGQVTVFDPYNGPCYRCLIPEPPPAELAPVVRRGRRARRAARHHRVDPGRRDHQGAARPGRPARSGGCSPTTRWRSRSGPSRCAGTRPARPAGPTPARSSSPSTTISACRTRTERRRHARRLRRTTGRLRARAVQAPCLKWRARPRPTCSRAPSPRPTRRRRRLELPGLTSRRVKRNRRLWVAGLVVLALVLVLVLSTAAAGTRRRRGRATAGRGTTTSRRRRTPGTPASIRTGTATGRPVTFAFGGDVHFPAGTNLGRPAGGRPVRRAGADGARAPLGRRPLHGEPRVRADGRHLPGPAAQAVRLLRAAVRRHRLPGRRRDADHRGQQPRRGLRASRPADGARDAGPDGLHDSRHRPERGAGLHPVHDHHPRPAHRHHRRHPGHRLRPADGVDGDRHPARAWPRPTT